MYKTVLLIANSTDPIGPLSWTWKNWLGLLLQVIFFTLAVIGLYYLGKDPENDK